MQKFQQALSCKTPQDYLPAAPMIAAVSATLRGHSAAEFTSSADVMTDSLLWAWERFGYDAVYAFAGAALEAEAVGTQLDYNVDGYPVISQYCKTEPSRLPDLPLPDLQSSGRLPMLLSTITRLRESLGEDTPVIAIACGPMTIAIHLMPIDEFLYLTVDDPELFDAILTYTTEVSKTVGAAMAKAGASAVILGDFSATPAIVPSLLYEEYLHPRHQEIVQHIRKNSAALIGMHIPDARMNRLHLIKNLKPDWIDADEVVSLGEVRSAIPDTALVGNVRPYLFVQGNQSDMKRAAEEAVEAAHAHGGVILGSASEVPLDASPEAIEAFVAAAGSYRHGS